MRTRFLRSTSGEQDAQSLIELSKLVGAENINLLNVVYDGPALDMWIAYAEGDEDAKTREYVQFKLKDYLEYDPKAEGVVAVVD